MHFVSSECQTMSLSLMVLLPCACFCVICVCFDRWASMQGLGSVSLVRTWTLGSQFGNVAFSTRASSLFPKCVIKLAIRFHNRVPPWSVETGLLVVYSKTWVNIISRNISICVLSWFCSFMLLYFTDTVFWKFHNLLWQGYNTLFRHVYIIYGVFQRIRCYYWLLEMCSSPPSFSYRDWMTQGSHSLATNFPALEVARLWRLMYVYQPGCWGWVSVVCHI